MSIKVFVDTNVLVYARDSCEPEKQVRAADWMATLWERRAGRLSYQVLQEFYITVTMKLSAGLDKKLARRDVRTLGAWQPIVADYPYLGRGLASSGPLPVPLVGRSYRGSGTAV